MLRGLVLQRHAVDLEQRWRDPLFSPACIPSSVEPDNGPMLSPCLAGGVPAGCERGPGLISQTLQAVSKNSPSVTNCSGPRLGAAPRCARLSGAPRG